MPAYLLYDDPKWYTRTGHVAFAVTDDNSDAVTPDFKGSPIFFRCIMR